MTQEKQKPDFAVQRKDADQNRTMGEIDCGLGVSPIYTLERPWMDNSQGISCIPPGVYEYEFIAESASGLYKDTGALWLKDVPDRTGILVHPSNFVSQLRGCIAPGLVLRKNSVGRSKDAMRLLVKSVPKKGTVEIKGVKADE